MSGNFIAALLYLPMVRVLTLLLATVIAAHAQAPSMDELYREASAAGERGDLAHAISLYEQLLERQPDSAELRTNLGVLLVRARRYGEAVTQYQEALKRAPQNPVIELNLALAWYKQADFGKAAVQLEALRKIQPGNRQSLHLLADCYLRLEKNREAAALLEPVYEADASDRAVQYALGMALISDGQVQRGSAVIDRILRDGSTPETDLLIGAAQLAAGDHKAATVALRKVVEGNPHLPGAWSLLGRALLDNQEYEQAKAAFRRALDADSSDFDAHLYLGGMLRHDGQAREALPHLEQALRLRPNSGKARYQVGALKAAMGEPAEALKYLEPLAKEWPEFQQVHVQLAWVYQRLHRTEDSRREQQMVLKLDAKEREARPQNAAAPQKP